MLSNIDLKNSQNKNHESVEKHDSKPEQKIDINLDRNSSAKYKNNANVMAIKNEVLQLARMRNACSDCESQSHSISSQLRPDLYRIAFDDPSIDDLSVEPNEQFENEVINDEELKACIDLYGKIIDDENVETLPSEVSQHNHIFVNQLSLAEEFAIAESKSSETFKCNNNLENVSKFNKVVDQKQIQNNRTQVERGFSAKKQNLNNDRNSVPTHQNSRTSITNDLSSNVRKMRSPNDLIESQIIKRANAVSLHQLLVNSNNVVTDLPENSFSTIRDCICCSIM